MEIERLLDEKTKVCPECAETIKIKAKKCRYCQAQFDSEEVDRQVNAFREKLTKKMEGKVRCPKCKSWDGYKARLKDGTYHDYCPNCREPIKSTGVTDKKVRPTPSKKLPTEAPVKKKKTKIGCVPTIIILLVLLLVFGYVVNTCEESDKQKSEDAQLEEIYGKGKSKIDGKREKEILAQLKKVPASQYEKNQNLYKQLMSLNPDNALYKKKYEYYSAKIEEKRARESREDERLAAERQKKIEEQFSDWNGSHRNLERYIKENMLDPKSYYHIKTDYWDKGTYIIVKTTFRGKNAFGGLEINSTKAKVDDNGNLIQIY